MKHTEKELENETENRKQKVVKTESHVGRQKGKIFFFITLLHLNEYILRYWKLLFMTARIPAIYWIYTAIQILVLHRQNHYKQADWCILMQILQWSCIKDRAHTISASPIRSWLRVADWQLYCKHISNYPHLASFIERISRRGKMKHGAYCYSLSHSD